MNHRARHVALAVLASALLSPGCKDDIDYLRVVVTGDDPTLSAAPLDLHVRVSGAGRTSTFDYRATRKPAPDLSDFTVSFSPDATGPLDVFLTTRPSGDNIDWGGDLRVDLPGAGRTLKLPIAQGETQIQTIASADGDLVTAAPFGTQLVLTWPTIGKKTAVLPVNPDDLPGLGRAPEIGNAVSRVRVAARPSGDFTSELFAVSWIEDGATPILKTETRTERFEPAAIGGGQRASDLHVACARRELEPAIVSATFTDGQVFVRGHDVSGKVTSGPFAPSELARVNRIVGIAVTPDKSAVIAVNGDQSSLVQIDMTSGVVIHRQPVEGQVASMALNGDGTRLFVATVVGFGDQGKLRLEVYSVRTPTRTRDPEVVGPYPFIAGSTLSRVSLSSCALAWPEKVSDGTDGVRVRYQEIDVDGSPTGESHSANIGQTGVHFAPTVVCLSSVRAYVTFVSAPQPESSTASLAFRRLPLSAR